MTRGTIHGRAALTNGAPRHHHVMCSSGCGWRGTRTADSTTAVADGPPCPHCRAEVRAVQS